MPDDRLSELIEPFRVKPGTNVKLRDYDSGWAGDPKRPKEERKKLAEEVLTEDVSELQQAQDVLYASNSWSILVVLQAMDAAGKDGLIKHVMSGVNPSGCQVFSFKQPSAEELDHDFLWRAALRLPERGRIGIFNRSYYEEVLVVKVHKKLVENQRIPKADPDADKFWNDRYDSINQFERHLTRNGTRVVKFFLNVSQKEQHKRILKRLKDPKKHWKFSPSDLAESAFWDDYMKAYEDAISATSTKWAPWHIIPADHKWVSRAMVCRILTDTIEELKLKYPEVTDTQREAIEKARAEFEAEEKSE